MIQLCWCGEGCFLGSGQWRRGIPPSGALATAQPSALHSGPHCGRPVDQRHYSSLKANNVCGTQSLVNKIIVGDVPRIHKRSNVVPMVHRISSNAVSPDCHPLSVLLRGGHLINKGENAQEGLARHFTAAPRRTADDSSLARGCGMGRGRLLAAPALGGGADASCPVSRSPQLRRPYRMQHTHALIAT